MFAAAGWPELKRTHGETITVKPAGSPAFSAIGRVQRTTPNDRDAQMAGVRAHCVVTLDNSAATGLSAAALNIGGDRLNFAHYQTDTARDWKIEKVIFADESRLTVQVY